MAPTLERTGAVPAQLRRARLGVSLLFISQGVLYGAWAPRIPLVQDRLGLDDAQLGLVLLGPGVGSLLGIPLIGPLARRFGHRRLIVGAGVVFVLAPVLMGLAPTAPLLLAALALWGAGLAVCDVELNSHAAEVDGRYDRPVLAGLHATWNVGTLTGSGLAITLLALDVTTAVALTATAALTAVISFPSIPLLLRLPAPQRRRGKLRVDPVLAALALLGFTVFLTEGAAGNWSAAYLTRVGADPATAGLGYTAFTLGSLAGRFSGNALFRRLGPGATVRVHTLIGAAVLSAALLLGGPAAGIAGFGAVGWGTSIVFAAIVGRVRRTRRGIEGLPLVVASGYLGLLAGPAVIGGLATATSLPVALGVLALGMLVCAASTLVSGRAGDQGREHARTAD